ncbi:hypothetical protein, conserved, partial [Trypanosoma vivax Y486]
LPKEGTPPTRFTALIVGKTDGTVDFLDSECAQPVGCSAGHTDSVLCAALDVVTDGITWVAVGYRDGWVKVYNAESRKLVRRFPQVHSSGVTTLTFAGERSTALSGHHTYIVSGSYDGTIHLLNISEGKYTLPHLPLVHVSFRTMAASLPLLPSVSFRLYLLSCSFLPILRAFPCFRFIALAFTSSSA